MSEETQTPICPECQQHMTPTPVKWQYECPNDGWVCLIMDIDTQPRMVLSRMLSADEFTQLRYLLGIEKEDERE